ncbi:hypothetical protein [Actinomadura oligospora]|uniref:hypothetical protein n=1 Tax=Actinomadura oligospora TaxID=111804 RepID=UPI0004B22A84|nr:hypothetical protein [Actinomadura oligospora]
MRTAQGHNANSSSPDRSVELIGADVSETAATTVRLARKLLRRPLPADECG